MKLSMAHLPHLSSQPPLGYGAFYHHSLQDVLNNHAVATLPTVHQPSKISHHSHQRNKSVYPHPNPVNPPGYGGGQNRIKKYFVPYLFITMLGILLNACHVSLHLLFLFLNFQGGACMCALCIFIIICKKEYSMTIPRYHFTRFRRCL